MLPVKFDHQIISTNIKQVVISCQFCPPSNRAWSEILSSKIEEPVLPPSTNGSIAMRQSSVSPWEISHPQ